MMSMSKTDTKIKYVWYRVKKFYFRMEYAYYVMANGPKPYQPHFLIRCNRNRLPYSDWWVFGPIFESQGIKNATLYMKFHWHIHKYAPKTYKYSSPASIKARHRNTLNSVFFNPVVPATRVVPFFRPAFMRVSS